VIAAIGQFFAAVAQAGTAPTEYRYTRPFLQPLPVWDCWPFLLLPLCLAVALVYKSIKCRKANQVPKEAAVLTAWILAGLAGAAIVLAGIVKLVAWVRS
jgi:hypothetical protein